MEFKEVLQGRQAVLVEFSAKWCGPCQTMEVLLDEIISQNSNRFELLKIDIDQNPLAAAAFSVRSVPTLILFKDGEILWKKSGLISKNELEEVLSQKTGDQ